MSRRCADSLQSLNVPFCVAYRHKMLHHDSPPYAGVGSMIEPLLPPQLCICRVFLSSEPGPCLSFSLAGLITKRGLRLEPFSFPPE